MTPVAPMIESDLPLLERVHQGKVRDIYALPQSPEGEERVLLVATDRISAFDVVMPDAIPRKGEVLTRLSAYWYGGPRRWCRARSSPCWGRRTPRSSGSPTHAYFGRSMVMRRAEVLKVECVVRGYLAGSGWRDYQARHGGSRACGYLEGCGRRTGC
jgi:phosphoribosylaminoimidazole-succinocarboxamide synthase